MSVCLGASVAMVVVGLTRCVDRAWDVPFASSVLVIMVSLIGLAVGLRAPRAVARIMFTMARRHLRLASVGAEVAEVWYRRRSEDRSLYWVVLSIVALLAGVATASLPVLAWLGFLSFDWMLQHFLWSTTSLCVLQWSVLFLVGILPMALQGLAMSFAHRLSSRGGEWDTRATGWLLVGAAAGVLIAESIGRMKGTPELLLVAAAMPTLLVAALCAGFGSSARSGDKENTTGPSTQVPVHVDRWPELLRLAIACVGGASACVMWLWCASLASLGREALRPTSMMLVWLGMGVLLGCRLRRDAQRSIGGFGLTCLVAGFLTAVGGPFMLDGHGPQGWRALVICWLSIGSIGCAMAYGRQTLLQRVAFRAATGAVILSRILIYSAVTIGITAPLARHFLGAQATLVLVALSLVAVAGTLIIHDPLMSTRTRTFRLGAVFGILALMMATAFLGRGSVLSGRHVIRDAEAVLPAAESRPRASLDAPAAHDGR